MKYKSGTFLVKKGHLYKIEQNWSKEFAYSDKIGKKIALQREWIFYV